MWCDTEGWIRLINTLLTTSHPSSLKQIDSKSPQVFDNMNFDGVVVVIVLLLLN